MTTPGHKLRPINLWPINLWPINSGQVNPRQVNPGRANLWRFAACRDTVGSFFLLVGAVNAVLGSADDRGDLLTFGVACVALALVFRGFKVYGFPRLAAFCEEPRRGTSQ
jgi:hypothetical protein